MATLNKNRSRKVLKDGTIVGVIPSHRYNKSCLQLWFDQLYALCPIYHIQNHTLFKNASQALIAYLYFLINNQVGQGHCPFHHQTVAKQPTETCHISNRLERSLGVPLGSKFVWYPQCIPVSFVGDGGPVKNVTRIIRNLVAMMLQILGLGMSISQSITCGACVMLSTLSESDSKLTPIIQQIGSSLIDKGCLAIHAVKPDIFVCLNVKRFNVGDWKFTFTHLNLRIVDRVNPQYSAELITI